MKYIILILLTFSISGCTILLIKNNEDSVTVHMSDEYHVSADSAQLFKNTIHNNKTKYKHNPDTLYLDTTKKTVGN